MSFFGDIFEGIGNVLGIGESATDAARAAGDADIAAITQGLDYVKPIIDQRVGRENIAADQLLRYYTDPAYATSFYDEVAGGPTYDYLTGLGEDAVLRSASATGSLRTGGTKEAFSQVAPRIAQNLVGQRLQGLSYFSQPTDIMAVPSIYRELGAAGAAREQAIGQAKQDKYGNILNLGTKIAGFI